MALQPQSGTSGTQETAGAIMQQVRGIGHYPKDYAGRGAAEQRFALEQEAELVALRAQWNHLNTVSASKRTTRKQCLSFALSKRKNK